MNDSAASRLVRPNIQEQDISALPREELSDRFDALNVRDAKLFGAIGFKQIA
jgi:hypothetical protein